MTAANTWNADISDTVNTVMGTVNWGAIPDKLDFRLTYAMSLSKDIQAPLQANNGNAAYSGDRWKFS